MIIIHAIGCILGGLIVVAALVCVLGGAMWETQGRRDITLDSERPVVCLVCNRHMRGPAPLITDDVHFDYCQHCITKLQRVTKHQSPQSN